MEPPLRLRRRPGIDRGRGRAARPGLPGADVAKASAGRWIDVYENDGKRSGAYSAPVYGVHPYMLMNWNETLDDVFTLAHEMGHSMHTMLSHERQPFVYSDYTIFVAEVPSTLSEVLLLEHLLERATDRSERMVLLQHAIDNITSTFYTQVLFADFELAAHVRVEQDESITADVLNDLYKERFDLYYGDSVDLEALTPITWARIPHFFNTPYYVYQYATCFASAAKIASEITSGSERLARGGAAPVPGAAGGRGERPPDDAAAQRGGRSGRGVDGERDGRAARFARQPARGTRLAAGKSASTGTRSLDRPLHCPVSRHFARGRRNGRSGCNSLTCNDPARSGDDALAAIGDGTRFSYARSAPSHEFPRPTQAAAPLEEH